MTEQERTLDEDANLIRAAWNAGHEEVLIGEHTMHIRKIKKHVVWETGVGGKKLDRVTTLHERDEYWLITRPMNTDVVVPRHCVEPSKSENIRS